MSGILSVILVLGVLGGGVYLLINRCQFLNLCDQPASADPSSSGGGTSPASASDNGKQCSKGCCTCNQTSPTNITCKTTGGNVLHLTSGSLSLVDQCVNCNNTQCGNSQSKVGSTKKCGCCSCTQMSGTLIRCKTSKGNSYDFTSGLTLDAQCKACSDNGIICPRKDNPKLVKLVSNKKQEIASKSIDFSIPAGTAPPSRPKCSDLGFCKPGSPDYNPDFCNQAQCTVSGFARKTYFADAVPRNPFKSHISYI